MSATRSSAPAYDLLAPLQPPTRYLFGPGPSMVHPRVYQALSKPIVGHLDPFFIQVMQDVQELLKRIFGAKDASVLVISGTGSAGMEAAVANFVEPGSKIAVFANGYFSDRLTEMAKRQGANVVRLEKPWGETYGDAEISDFIRRERPSVVGYVHAETSTGALQPGRGICAAAHEVGALVIADCVTSLGGLAVDFDQTGIDIAYSCTQKGLSCPPGLCRSRSHPAPWTGCVRKPLHRAAGTWISNSFTTTPPSRIATITPLPFPCSTRCGKRCRSLRKKASRIVGTVIAAATDFSFVKSRPWDCACTCPPNSAFPPSTLLLSLRAWMNRKFASGFWMARALRLPAVLDHWLERFSALGSWVRWPPKTTCSSS